MYWSGFVYIIIFICCVSTRESRQMRGIRFWWLSECDRIVFKNIPNKLGILFLKINHCCCSLLCWILPREFLFLFRLNEDVQQLYVQKKAFHHMTPYTKNQPITRDFADRRPHNFEAESLICITLHPKRHLFQTKYAVFRRHRL